MQAPPGATGNVSPPPAYPTMPPPAYSAPPPGRLPTILGAIALVLAVAALAVAFGVPGPTGASGPTGSTGAAGTPGATGSAGSAGANGAPGVSALTASSNAYNGLDNFGSATCGSWAGANVTITTPAAGIITVLAQVDIVVEHTVGTADGGGLFIDNSTTTEACLEGYNWASGWYVDSAEPTAEYNPIASVENVFQVSTAGAHSYSIFGYVGGGSSDDFYSTNMIAMYTPA